MGAFFPNTKENKKVPQDNKTFNRVCKIMFGLVRGKLILHTALEKLAYGMPEDVNLLKTSKLENVLVKKVTFF